ncbi:MAG: Gfo/Idh/MocA family oxidoreductase, partial [Verrucomicrobiota bacterium]
MKQHSSSSTRRSRRQFLKQTATAGALTIVPSSYVLGEKNSEGEIPPSERVRVAAIGIGNQGESNIRSLYSSGLCDIVALCDVDLKGKHTQKAQEAHPDARLFTDFREMFDKMENEIDAVLVATADHAHFSQAMLAMSLGKPVYVQKPLAHTYGQCSRLIDLAARSGVATQMGNQGHSGANYFQFKAWTEAGVIKDVTRITAHMNNPRRWHGWGASVTEYPSEPLPEGVDWDVWTASAPEHPFSSKLHPAEWRSWFDYGCGAFGDWGPHILDTAHRFLELGLPTEIEAVKLDQPNAFVYPQASTIRFHFDARGDMPPCDVTWYDGTKNKPEVEPELDFEVKGPGKIIYGKDLTFKGGSHASPLTVVPKEKYLDVRESLPRISGKNSDHFENFLLACKGEEEARSPFSVSGVLTQVFCLGIIAQRLGGTLKFDPATGTFPDNAEAQALLDPAPREGWEEYNAQHWCYPTRLTMRRERRWSCMGS